MGDRTTSVKAGTTDVAGSTGSFYSRVTKCVAVINSSDRKAPGEPGNFSIYLQPQVSRAVGFTVAKVEMPNSWYTINNGENTSLWSYVVGGVTTLVTVTIPYGYYPAPDGSDYPDTPEASMFRTLKTIWEVLFAAVGGKIVLTQSNQIQWNSTAGDRVTYVSGPLGELMGLDEGATWLGTLTGSGVYGPSDASGVPTVGWFNGRFFDEQKVDVVSGQLTEMMTSTSRSDGANNSFCHLFADADKLREIRLDIESPYESNITKFGSPTSLSYAQIRVQGKDGRDVTLRRDWRMEIWFWCLAS